MCVCQSLCTAMELNIGDADVSHDVGVDVLLLVVHGVGPHPGTKMDRRVGLLRQCMDQVRQAVERSRSDHRCPKVAIRYIGTMSHALLVG